MGKLSSGDVGALLDAVSTISRSADPAVAILPAVGHLIGCDVISYNEVDWGTGSVRAMVWPERWVSALWETAPEFENVLADNPLVVDFRGKRGLVVARFEDVTSDRDLFVTSFYQRFFRPLGFPASPASTLRCSRPWST